MSLVYLPFDVAAKRLAEQDDAVAARFADSLNSQDKEHASRRTVDELQRWFGVEFSIWDGAVGELLYRGRGQPPGDELARAELVRAMAERESPQFIGDEDCLLLLAIPLPETSGPRHVAVAAFVTDRRDTDDCSIVATHLLGLDQPAAGAWIKKQMVWAPDMLMRLAGAVLEKLSAEARADRLEHEIEAISDNLASTYEEISLLYTLTRNLRVSIGEEELGQLTLDWLAQCLPAQAVALQFLPVVEEGTSTYRARAQAELLARGQCPLNCDEFSRLIEILRVSPGCSPVVINQNITSGAKWQFPTVRELIVVPLTEGENVFGWLAAFNQSNGREFGTVEASLLSTIGAILGVHSGNRELVRQQAEFLASVVRALTSAIDAKDPYTSGHSDRVARISVRLMREFSDPDDGDGDLLNTVYMAGLLHDIGKIGIDEGVLRKPGRLTAAEFEHIKLHPTLGYKILADIKQFTQILPVVLYHHEQWDGRGYPEGLRGEDIPLLARVVAVADAYDAMTSDRPYRRGMPVEEVNRIFLAGAGKQWDQRVIEAYFRARDDIRTITGRERANLTLDVQQWT